MIQRKIKISDKEVNVAYCYATEIAFYKYTGRNIESFDAQNPEDVIYLILSAIVSYYQSKDEEPPFKAEELMYEAKPKDIIEAITEVFKMRAEWYDVPTGDKVEEQPTEEEEGENEKNA